jgi:hypothetical protein
MFRTWISAYILVKDRILVSMWCELSLWHLEHLIAANNLELVDEQEASARALIAHSVSSILISHQLVTWFN